MLDWTYQNQEIKQIYVQALQLRNFRCQFFLDAIKLFTFSYNPCVSFIFTERYPGFT